MAHPDRLVVVAGTRMTRAVLHLIAAINDVGLASGRPARYECIGTVGDDPLPPHLMARYGVAHLGGLDLLTALPTAIGCVLAVEDPHERQRLDERCRRAGRLCPALVHPQTNIGTNVAIGEGCLLFHGTQTNSDVTFGRHVHTELGAGVGHGASVGDYTTLRRGAVLAGDVTVGPRTRIGMGAIVNEKRRIGADARIGNGAVVVKDVDDAVEVHGIPAKPRTAASA